MWITIILYLYIIPAVISMAVFCTMEYTDTRKKSGKRKAQLAATKAGFMCLVPFFPPVGVFIVLCMYFQDKIKKWADADPTDPKNVADPKFNPPPKKEKKFKPIKDRFEIMDL